MTKLRKQRGMKKKSKIEVKMICDKCGKEQKPDDKGSNENWLVYPNVPCKCGGNYKPDILTND
jgi:ribosomal protein S26